MLKINPLWGDFSVFEEKSKIPTIYSDAMKAANLFYNILCRVLVDELGFKMNLYDRCVANKTINKRKCTIVLHVDDVKISHIDEKVVTKIIEELDKRFGDTIPLSIRRGKVHDYLGTKFDYTTAGKLMITRYDYITGVIGNMGETYKTGAGSATPAPKYLFETRESDKQDDELLSIEEREEYHKITAQCLYLSKRGRPDIQQSVIFHCTRVEQPTRDNQKKLARTIKYLMLTKHLLLMLSMNNNWISEMMDGYLIRNT